MGRWVDRRKLAACPAGGDQADGGRVLPAGADEWLTQQVLAVTGRTGGDGHAWHATTSPHDSLRGG